MAAAGALTIALALGLLNRNGFRPADEPQMLPASIIAVQTVALTLLLAGFRRAARLPAELNANWVLQLTWRDSKSRFLMGVKRAAIVGVAVPTLLALAPLHLWLLADRTAIAHLVVGWFYSILAVELLFARCAKVPFASAYEPLTHVKTIGPIVFLLFLMFVHAFARAERDALRTDAGVVTFCLALFVLFALARIVQFRQRAVAPPMTFGEPPEPATQWLGLSG
jgi:hypothetical protein